MRPFIYKERQAMMGHRFWFLFALAELGIEKPSILKYIHVCVILIRLI